METGKEGETAGLSDAGRTLEPDVRQGERMARPLCRRAVRGQGRFSAQPLLPGHRRRAGDGSHRGQPAANPAHARHRHGQDVHRVSDRLETVLQPLEPERLENGTPPSRRPRILFLADRNNLADQAYNNFSAFPEDAMVRISPEDIRKKGKVPKNASLFFTIFQTFMSGPPKDGEPSPYFGEYPPDFFDFIVIDECHRGGANDESNWRGIMDYFAPAVQLGLTATPKRKENADTYAYFGEPVYIYSLQGGHQ